MLIIVRGIPGSGKSTLAKKLCALLGGAYYEADMFFEQTGEYIFDPTKLAEAHCSGKYILPGRTHASVYGAC